MSTIEMFLKEEMNI